MAFTPNSDQAAFARIFLADLRAPVTPNNVSNVGAWEQAESGSTIGPRSGKSGGVWNPLNVVRTSGIPDVGMGGSQGNIANYPDLTTGAHNTARWFSINTHPQVRTIITTLQRDGSRAELNAAINSFYGVWGGGLTLPDSGSAAGGGGGIDLPNLPKLPFGGPDLPNLPAFGIPGAGVLGDLKDAFGLLPKVLGTVTSTEFWKRAGIMALGLALLGVAVFMLLQRTQVGQAALGVAGGAATGGASKAAKAAL